MARRIVSAREQVEMLSPWLREASWFHPEIGIEEYPALTRKERKALYGEIKAQGGPEVLSNVYHPENWGSGDPTGEHHYIARGQDGTIHGVLAATRSYKTMEPKRPGSYSYLNVHDIYTGADAPKGTGTALMQAAAHRAMRDGASFEVSGAVHSARPFYHNLGGTTNEINLSSCFDWEPEDRDALAMGKPNRKPVTPMPLDVWNSELKRYEKHYKMPPGADESPEFGDIFVDNSLRQRQTTAARSPSRPGYAQWGIIGDDRHMFPLETLIPHMTRSEVGFGDEKSSYQSGPPLSQRITEQGYENPVEFETDGQSGYLRDGNHRLDVARTLGHSHVPVQVRWNSNSDGSPIGAPIHPWIKDWLAGMAPGHKTVGRRITASEFPLFLNKHGEPMGININDSKQDFTGQILRGEKSIETRDSNSLRRYIGKRIGLIRTGLGKAHVVGYATIGEPKFYDDVHDFDADYDLHRVDTNSDYHFDYAKYGVKFGYPFHDVEHEPDPYPVDSLGNVDRPIPRQAERAEDFEWERNFDGPGGWELITRTPDGNPVTVRTEPTRGQRTAALSDEDRVSVAENVMERSGHGGRRFTIPTASFDDARVEGLYDEHGSPDAWALQRHHSKDAEDYVNGILKSRGWGLAQQGYRVRVEPEHWDLRNGGGQACTDGLGYIGLAGNHTNALALLHETAHILTRTPHGSGGHGPDFQQAAHDLYHEHIHPEAAKTFAGIVFPDHHTAATDKTLEQHLRDTYEPHPPGDPGLPEGLVPHLMLPTDIAHHYREYDRPMDDENTAMLTRVIADQGIRQPLRISTDGTHAILHEGNHRLTVARQLGISHVPVQVTLEKPGEIMTNSATSRPVPLEPVLGGWVSQNRQNLKSFWS